MVEKLRIKVIYDDFVGNVSLTEEQQAILKRLIKKEKIIKIAIELGMSERKVKYEIKRIKDLYSDYLQFEMTKFVTLLK